MLEDLKIFLKQVGFVRSRVFQAHTGNNNVVMTAMREGGAYSGESSSAFCKGGTTRGAEGVGNRLMNDFVLLGNMAVFNTLDIEQVGIFRAFPENSVS